MLSQPTPSHVYRTESPTEHGPTQVWLDDLLRWQGNLPEPSCWYQASRLLSDLQCREALEAADQHVSDLLRRINDVFSDTSDPVGDRWHETAQLVLNLDLGLTDYYLDAAELFDDQSLALMPAFVHEPRFCLTGGQRNFQLRTCRSGGTEILGWFQVADPDQVFVDSGGSPQPVELADLVDYAVGVETARIVTRHLDAIAELGTEIRYVMNKIRSGVAISRNERERFSGYAASIIEFQRQYDAVE